MAFKKGEVRKIKDGVYTLCKKLKQMALSCGTGYRAVEKSMGQDSTRGTSR